MNKCSLFTVCSFLQRPQRKGFLGHSPSHCPALLWLFNIIRARNTGTILLCHPGNAQVPSSANNEIFRQVCRWQRCFWRGNIVWEKLFAQASEWLMQGQWKIDVWKCRQSTSALIERPGFPRIMGGEKIPAYEIHPVILSSRKFLITHPTSYFHADSSLRPPSRLSWSDKLCIHRGLDKKSG